MTDRMRKQEMETDNQTREQSEANRMRKMTKNGREWRRTRHHVPKWTLNLNLAADPIFFSSFYLGHIVETHSQASPNGSQMQGNWQELILH